MFRGQEGRGRFVLDLYKKSGPSTHHSQRVVPVRGKGSEELGVEHIGAPTEQQGPTYSDLEIHHLLREGAHLIIETEHVFSSLFRCEYRV